MSGIEVQTATPLANYQHHGQTSRLSQAVSQYGTTLQLNISNSATSISDMAEEMGFAAADKTKTLSERKRASDSKDESTYRNAENYLQHMLVADAKDQLQLYIQKSTPNKEELAAWISEFSQDHAEQFCALEMIFREAPNATLSSTAKAIQKDLYAIHGSEIRASLNIAGVANNFDHLSDSATPAQLREFYRTTVEEYEGPIQTYNKIVEVYGHEAFLSSLSFLRQALSTDLACQNSSIEKAKLHSIIKDIKELSLLNTVHNLCTNLIEKLQKNFGQSSGVTGQNLMGLILKLAEKKWVTPSDFAAFPKSLKVPNPPAQMYLAHQVKSIFAKLPENVFSDSNQQFSHLDEFALYIDGLIEKEEEDQ